uniref:Uncharacterized protein n=1 Tax=Arundo donax TaxID=35708 RepID=A0A0A9CNU1_ARUDO
MLFELGDVLQVCLVMWFSAYVCGHR